MTNHKCVLKYFFLLTPFFFLALAVSFTSESSGTETKAPWWPGTSWVEARYAIPATRRWASAYRRLETSWTAMWSSNSKSLRHFILISVVKENEETRLVWIIWHIGNMAWLKGLLAFWRLLKKGIPLWIHLTSIFIDLLFILLTASTRARLNDWLDDLINGLILFLWKWAKIFRLKEHLW